MTCTILLTQDERDSDCIHASNGVKGEPQGPSPWCGRLCLDSICHVARTPWLGRNHHMDLSWTRRTAHVWVPRWARGCCDKFWVRCYAYQALEYHLRELEGIQRTQKPRSNLTTAKDSTSDRRPLSYPKKGNVILISKFCAQVTKGATWCPSCLPPSSFPPEPLFPCFPQAGFADST